MKKFVILTLLSFTTVLALKAQKLVIGEKAPDLKVKEWLSEKPSGGNQAELIEFFHTSSKQCSSRLAILNATAQKYAGKLTVILVAKEPADKIRPAVSPGNKKFATAIDDAGKTFENYGVQFVPFSVLVDKKGKVVWFGNPSSLTDDTISKALK